MKWFEVEMWNDMKLKRVFNLNLHFKQIDICKVLMICYLSLSGFKISDVKLSWNEIETKFEMKWKWKELIWDWIEIAGNRD